MPAQKKFSTDYPGVFYIEGMSPATGKPEKIYYIMYRKNGRLIDEKAGRQVQDDMTPARASKLRALKMAGKIPTNKERREAEKAEKEAKDKRYTIKKLWEKYQENKPDLKGMHTYKSLYELHIGPSFADKEPQDIRPLDVVRISKKLLKKRSPQLVQHVLELLRRLCNYGNKQQLSAPLNFKIEMPDVDNIKTEDLTSSQIKKLLKVIDKDKHPAAGPMMKLALYTGMRRGEMFRLHWKDVDFERGFIWIRNPKGGKDQKIPLNEAARKLLKNHPKTKSRYVFPGRSGGQLQTVAKPANKIKKDAGLPPDFRPLHGLRHVYASMLASSGKVDLYTLQKLLTHQDPGMTQRYAHLRDEALKKASELAGNIISDAARSEDKDEKVAKLEDYKK